MTSTNNALMPHEVAELLGIRLSRVAQMLRTGILPYLETKDLPLIHREAALMTIDLFPMLIAHFREEKQSITGEELGEDNLDPQNYLRPSTIALMRCVNAQHPTVPIGR